MSLKRSFAAVLLPISLLVPSVSGYAKVTLTYWEKWSGFEQTIIQSIVDKYNKSQNEVFVKYVLMPDNLDKFLATCIAGNPPDIVGDWNHTLPPYVLNNVAEPMDKYLKLMNISSKDLIPSYWDMMSYKGKVYGMPITPACFATYWNKKLFSEAGLDPNKPPKTMDDILLYNDKLSKKDAAGRYTQIGFSPSIPNWYPYMWPVAFGADIYNDSKDTINFSDPAMVRTFKWVQAVSAQFGGTKGLTRFTNAHLSATGPFISGKSAIDLIGSFLPSYLAKYNPSMKYGVDDLPVGQGGKNWSWIEGDVVFMPRGGKRNKEAAKFIGYLMRPDVQQEFQLKRETFSTVAAANTPDFISKNKNPFIRDIIRVANSQRGAYTPKTLAWGDLSFGVYGKLFDAVFGGTKSPEQALKEAQALADPIIKRKARKK